MLGLVVHVVECCTRLDGNFRMGGRLDDLVDNGPMRVICGSQA